VSAPSSVTDRRYRTLEAAFALPAFHFGATSWLEKDLRTSLR
jgi:hypothetical protein